MSESVQGNEQDEDPDAGLKPDDDLASAIKANVNGQVNDEADVSESQVSVRKPSLLGAGSGVSHTDADLATADAPGAEADAAEADAEAEADLALSGVDADSSPDSDAAELDSNLDSDVEIEGLTDDADAPSSAEEDIAPPQEDPDEELPRMLGERYRLESLLAKGGMGRVYRAKQLPLERNVAIKVLGSTSGLDAAYRRRFLLEASVCASLTHPNIVVVHDYGETPDGVLFMAMELLEGRRLSQVLVDEGPMPVGRGAFVALQIARALREAHRQGVAHRDLKPGNVFLRATDDDAQDEVKVFDFGLAKILQTAPALRDQELTMDGVMMGSPRYMSPEQIRGEEVDARADIYSFGALLYTLLCGRPPFLAPTSIDVLTAHIQQEPPSFAEALLERGHAAPPEPIPTALEALAMRCLEKDRTKRYQSIDQPILELKRVLREIAGERYDDGLTSASFVFSEEETQTLPPNTPPPRALNSDAVNSAALRSSSMPPPAVTPVPAPAVQSAGSIAAPSPEKSRLPGIVIALLVAIIIGAGFAILLPGDSESPIEAAVEVTRVAVASDPPGATVYLDGVRQGVTPFESTYELGSSQTFRFRLTGYEDELVRSEIGEGDIDVSLHALAPPAQILPSAETRDPEPPRPVGARPQNGLAGMTPMPGTMQQRDMQQSAMQQTATMQQTAIGMRGPSVSMSVRPTATMTDPISRPTGVVPLDEPSRGLVDDSSRVPLVD